MAQHMVYPGERSLCAKQNLCSGRGAGWEKGSMTSWLQSLETQPVQPFWYPLNRSPGKREPVFLACIHAQCGDVVMPRWGSSGKEWAYGSNSNTFTALTETQEIFLNKCLYICCMPLGEFPDTLNSFIMIIFIPPANSSFAGSSRAVGLLMVPFWMGCSRLRQHITQNVRLSITFWNFHLSKHIFQNFVSSIIAIKGRLTLLSNLKSLF